MGAYHATESSIRKRLFKDTECGISAGVGDGKFWASGYCEGSDWEHEVYTLEFPFSEENCDKIVQQADADGNATWDQTHGCESCFPEGSVDQWGNEFAGGDIGGPIDPDCAVCNGYGTTL